MHRLPKQEALPYQLGGEHFRHHYIALSDQRPLPDVDRCVGVRVRGVSARDAEESGLIGSVLFVDASAHRALARRVSWINEDHGDADALRLVGDECAELAKSPITQSCALVAPGRYPAADALQLFEGDPASGAFSIHHDSLGNAVVGVFLEPRLLSGEVAQSPLGCLGAALLKSIPALLVVAALPFDSGPGIDLAIAIGGQRDDAEINAQPVFGLKLVGFRYVAGNGQHPFAAHEAQIDFALAIHHQPILVFTHHDWHDDAPFDCPQANRATVLNEPNDPIVIRLSGIWAKDWSDGAIDLEGVGDLGDRSDSSLGGQTEACSQLDVMQLVQIVLPEGAAREARGAQPCACFIASRQRRLQARGLSGRRQHLEGGYQLHAVKYRLSSSTRARSR